MAGCILEMTSILYPKLRSAECDCDRQSHLLGHDDAAQTKLCIDRWYALEALGQRLAGRQCIVLV